MLHKHTGNVQTFTAPIATNYKIECWGAQGGTVNNIASDNPHYIGGKGAYTVGLISLTLDYFLYIYVGQCGSITKGLTTSGGGWNGGGNGDASENDGNTRTGGGGSTDIRITSGNWNAWTSLKSRIMVAGAGGGGGGDGAAGAAGALTGFAGDVWDAGKGGTQSAGGAGATGQYGSSSPGGFGYGGTGNSYASGGGGGYYGGGGGARAKLDGTGGGGSSFISGHTGCNAISSTSTSTNIVHTGQPNHYSGYVFTNTVMKAGNESMPSPTGGTETGHGGNGYCKITWHPAL